MRPPIAFVVGVHRSGTSLLHALLRAHPRVSGFHDTGVPEDEGHHLQSVVPRGDRAGGPGRFGRTPGAVMDETHPLATPATAEALLRAWTPHWRADADLWVEKSPPHLLRTRFLQALFPDARFVAVLRHPIPIAYATHHWTGVPIGECVDHTLFCYERLRADAPRLSRLTTIRYDAVAADPAGTTAAVFEGLGLPPHPPAVEVRPDLDDAYRRRLERDRRSAYERRRLGLDALPALAERTRALGFEPW